MWTDDIAGWVAEAATTGGHDLVVKSIHQSQTLLHTPLDWQLLRTSPAPVLLSSSRTRSNGCVLAALDLRNPDVLHQQLNEEVLAAAQHFAELYGADMRCVSVLEVSKVLTDLDWIDKYATEKKLAATYKEHAEPLLARFDIDPDRLELVSGKVGAAVNQTAHRRNARLLVVGRCAQPLRQALKLGNSAERILSRAQCDVLAVGPYGK